MEDILSYDKHYLDKIFKKMENSDREISVSEKVNLIIKLFDIAENQFDREKEDYLRFLESISSISSETGKINKDKEKELLELLLAKEKLLIDKEKEEKRPVSYHNLSKIQIESELSWSIGHLNLRYYNAKTDRKKFYIDSITGVIKSIEMYQDVIKKFSEFREPESLQILSKWHLGQAKYRISLTYIMLNNLIVDSKKDLSTDDLKELIEDFDSLEKYKLKQLELAKSHGYSMLEIIGEVDSEFPDLFPDLIPKNERMRKNFFIQYDKTILTKESRLEALKNTHEVYSKSLSKEKEFNNLEKSRFLYQIAECIKRYHNNFQQSPILMARSSYAVYLSRSFLIYENDSDAKKDRLGFLHDILTNLFKVPEEYECHKGDYNTIQFKIGAHNESDHYFIQSNGDLTFFENDQMTQCIKISLKKDNEVSRQTLLKLTKKLLIYHLSLNPKNIRLDTNESQQQVSSGTDTNESQQHVSSDIIKFLAANGIGFSSDWPVGSQDYLEDIKKKSDLTEIYGIED